MYSKAEKILLDAHIALGDGITAGCKFGKRKEVAMKDYERWGIDGKPCSV